MKKTFAVQHVGRPYGPGEPIPEEAWSEFSRHASQEAAEKAVERYCGHLEPCQWDDHFRIVPLQDRTLRFYLVCHECGKNRHVEVKWDAFAPAPECPIPQGWATPEQCVECEKAMAGRDA